MAKDIIIRYSLLELTISMEWQDGIQIRTRVQRGIRGRIEAIWDHHFPAAAFGLDGLNRDMKPEMMLAWFKIPQELSRVLRESGNMQPQSGSRAFWLHLVPPYGPLGALPWERELQATVGCPILRHPDFEIPPPRETPDMLDVVIFASSPRVREPIDFPDYLAGMMYQIQKSVRHRQITFHVFTDGNFYRKLEHYKNHPSSNITIYDPGGVAKYAVSEANPDPSRHYWLTNPWLLWIRDVLGDRSADVVHLIGHGYHTTLQGAIAVAQPPWEKRGFLGAGLVSLAELSIFLTQLGARAVAVSALQPNYSEFGLRWLADELANRLPLAALYHEIKNGLAADAHLGDAYAFLFNRGDPPRDDHLILYCQPWLAEISPREPGSRMDMARGPVLYPFVNYLMGEVLKIQRHLGSPPAATNLLEAIFKEIGYTPSWITASERSMDQCLMQLNRLSRRKREDPKDTGAKREMEVVEKTFHQIQQALMKVIRENGSMPDTTESPKPPPTGRLLQRYRRKA